MTIKLLIVDDDRLSLRTISQGLIQSGYSVVAVGNENDALATVTAEQFDLAILDIYLNNAGSGIDLGKTLSETYHLPAVYLSAYNDADTVNRAIKEGGLSYMVKPLDVTQMVPVIEAALARANDLKTLETQNETLNRNLNYKRKTNTAVGIIMERNGLSFKEAFESLRNTARNQRRKMEELAEDIINASNLLNSINKT